MARRRQAVTIKHVAADAGVSLQTVSRVINREPNVRAVMRERVQASIDKLGYVPSIAAQRMSGSRSYLILVLEDRDRTIAYWRAREGIDRVDQMLLGGMLECAEHGYRLIFELVDTASESLERELAASIAALQPDGVLLLPPHSDDPRILNAFARHNVPCARLCSRQGGEGIRINMDEERAAGMAARHLIDLGHRRIGFIAGPDTLSYSARRVMGWRAEMEQAGLPTGGMLQAGALDFESGKAAALALLGKDDRPTAIIAGSDRMALGAIEAAGEMGLVVPGDLSLISFDNTALARFAHPALTAVDQPTAEMVARAVRMLIAAQREEEGGEQDAVLGAELVVRASTAAPRALSCT